jgi:hypothetical protein
LRCCMCCIWPWYMPPELAAELESEHDNEALLSLALSLLCMLELLTTLPSPP